MTIRTNLLFLSNELLSPSRHRELNIPFEFISYAILEAKMYKYFRSERTFNTRVTRDWGNSMVYGALFLLRDFDFYIRLIDAYHTCSLTTLRRNHIKDMQHRVKERVTPIYFNSIAILAQLKYSEGETVHAHAYVANPNHPTIYQRTTTHDSYRIIDGIDKSPFLQLYKQTKGMSE